MKLSDLFEKWNLTDLKVKTPILDMAWSPKDSDKDAAWDLYVELLTRTATQALDYESGTEQAALSSIHSLFPTTREILKKHGRSCVAFSRVAIIVLNQIVRPFTAKWHHISENDGFKEKSNRDRFRYELTILQSELVSYSRLLSDIADVEDLTEMDA